MLHHANNKELFTQFLKSAERKGVRPSAPWEAVLYMYIEFANECNILAGKTANSENYMKALKEAIEEANSIIEN